LQPTRLRIDRYEPGKHFKAASDCLVVLSSHARTSEASSNSSQRANSCRNVLYLAGKWLWFGSISNMHRCWINDCQVVEHPMEQHQQHLRGSELGRCEAQHL
jgi:hypothetical protein